MTNVIPIVFCFDKRIILGASVAIKSLIECANDTTEYDIRIFHSDLDTNIQTKLTSLVENTNHNIAFHYINPKIFTGAPKSRGSWTEIVYYRFLIPEILNQYEKAIYSDVDVLFKDDLSDLYNVDISNYELGAVRAEKNVLPTQCHKYFSENKKEYIFWSGLLLLNNKKFIEEKIFNKLMLNAEKEFSKLNFFDLDLMNITCQNIKALDMRYCVLQSIYYNNEFYDSKDYLFLKNAYSDQEIQDAKNNPAIIHYAGAPGKPWRMKKPYDDYKRYMDIVPKSLKILTIRDIRKKLFNKV